MSDDQFSRTGRVMFLFVWIILFFGLFVFFYYYDNSGGEVFRDSQSEFAISADRSGHYRIKGKINEYPVAFLVDTGATLVAIPESLAKQLQVSGRYPVTISTANGEVTGSLTRLKQLSFGSFELHDVKAVIMPGAADDTVLLGMNVLSQFNLTQEDNLLILKKFRK